MAFEQNSSRILTMVAATIVTVATIVMAFLMDRLDAGVPMVVAGGWFTLLGSYIAFKSYQNAKVRSANIAAGNGHTTHEDGEG